MSLQAWYEQHGMKWVHPAENVELAKLRQTELRNMTDRKADIVWFWKQFLGERINSHIAVLVDVSATPV